MRAALELGMPPSAYVEQVPRKDRVLIEEYYRLLSLKEEARVKAQRPLEGTGKGATTIKGLPRPKTREKPKRNVHR